MEHSSSASTTFIQTDASTFRELVQRLTGATSSVSAAGKRNLPTAARTLSSPKSHSTSKPSSPKTQAHNMDGATAVRRKSFKLQERRPPATAMRKLEIKLGVASVRKSAVSLSTAATPARVQSPVTPIGRHLVFSARVGTESPPSAEEKAIAEKGFYLHDPSPRKSQPPELLTLFPLTSPRPEPWAA